MQQKAILKIVCFSLKKTSASGQMPPPPPPRFVEDVFHPSPLYMYMMKLIYTNEIKEQK